MIAMKGEYAIEHCNDSGSFLVTRQLEYRPQDFTEDGVLRVGFLLWAVLMFLNRHLILLVFGAVTSLIGSRFGLDSSGLVTLYSNPWFLLAGLPAVAVLAAALRRDPKAGRLIRRVWHNGRWLLAISAGLIFFPEGYPLILWPVWNVQVRF